MKLKILALCLILAFNNKGFSQKSEPEMSTILLDNDRIIEVNLDKDKFINSLAQISEYCKNNFSEIPKTQKIGLLIIFHKNGNPTYKCFSNPKLEPSLESKILKDLSELKMENTKLVDFPIFISINTENKGEITEFDDYVDPMEQKFIEYDEADLKTKLKLNKEFAINEVLPVLSAYQVIVDKQFEGVKNFGKLIEKTNFNTVQNIDNLTSKNKNYWRATVEMEIGNQIIPITKIFTLVSQGELDYAKKYIEVLRMFSNPETIAEKYLAEINYRINEFQKDLNKEIAKGIAEHDKGEYDKAISIYDGILKSYPNSSWTLYEKYYSENAKSILKNAKNLDSRKGWDLAKVEIYKHNPLYNMDVRANNGKEAYLIFRRTEIASLFKNENETLSDVFKYGEIAMDLGVYDFAAQLFWLSITFDKGDTEKAINYFLYCLDKLGEKELKANFKGNFDKIFKKIEEEKEAEMKKSSIYKSMKN